MEAVAWKKEQIVEKLAACQRWLERGVLAIYELQTEDEKKSHVTVHHNKVGFSEFDASFFTYIAEYLKSGNHLSNGYVEKVRNRMMKYAGQLTKIANKKV